MTNAPQQVYQSLRKSLEELSKSDIEAGSAEGTLAAELHGYYNKVGLRAGWLKPEYATPLSAQDATNKRKNIQAARDVLEYWVQELDLCKLDEPSEGLVQEMQKAVNYEANRGNEHLERASESQHEQWKRFVSEYQSERVTPGNPKFRQANYEQFNTPYSVLSEEVKDQDRLVVAVITDMVLARANVRDRQILV